MSTLREFPTASRTGILIPPITASREPAHHQMPIKMRFRVVPLPRTGVTRNPVARHSEPAPTILRAAVSKEAVLLTALRAVQAKAAAPTPVRAVQVAAAALTAVRAVPPEAAAIAAVHPVEAVGPP
jgi:hypothetical protein